MVQIVSSADEPLGTICFLLSVTGMRIGEVLALRVEDLDFKRKLLNVRCSTCGGKLGTPKSAASIADLPMPSALETRLGTYLASSQYRKNDRAVSVPLVPPRRNFRRTGRYIHYD
jgi:hypothetical protein